MFSVKQKRDISDAIQKILRETDHLELPEGQITFFIRVSGEKKGSYAIIQNNKAVPNPSVNPHNEAQDPDTPPRATSINQ